MRVNPGMVGISGDGLPEKQDASTSDLEQSGGLLEPFQGQPDDDDDEMSRLAAELMRVRSKLSGAEQVESEKNMMFEKHSSEEENKEIITVPEKEFKSWFEDES